MKNIDAILRRTHLYLGIFLLPWFLMYGISSLLISHHSWFRSTDPGWQPVFEKEYQFPADQYEDVREAALLILREHDLENAFWAHHPNPNRLVIHQFDFWSSNRLTYEQDTNRLTAEHQRLKLDQIILRMHFRGGFIHPGFLNFLWGVLVDIVCIAIMFWIVSGLYMWWKLRKLRTWGLLALAAGTFSFLLLLLGI
ncbi:MAG: PepSY domain-containing protein [bacterium]|jgi:hypothetical protein